MSGFPRKPYLAGESAAPGGASRSFVLAPPFVHGRTIASRVEDLPSIEEFLDHTPPIERFAPEIPEPHPATETQTQWTEPAATEWSWGGEAVAPPAPREETADWHAFDWGSAASLGSAPPDAAAEAWASTDWSEPGGSRESRQSAAEALARALDHISRRIRAGELRVPGPETVQDDAAIAATLAALLGIRR